MKSSDRDVRSTSAYAVSGPRSARRLRVVAALLAAAVPAALTGQEKVEEPRWRQQLSIGAMEVDMNPPWRSDRRLRGMFAQGFPDDVSAGFVSPENPERGERMWVRLFDYDAPTDQYLGTLLNSPHWLESPRQFENVVVRFDPASGILLGVGSEGNYSQPGRPDFPLGSFGAKVHDGLLEYRRAGYGGDQEAIGRCKGVLSQALDSRSPEHGADSHLLWIAHYLLGRCLAESYETQLAVEQFRKAIEVSPGNINAHMALLAEYSILVHAPEGEDIGDRAMWREEFLSQLSRVQEMGAGDIRVDGMLKSLFDAETRERAFGEVANQGAEELTEDELEHRRIFGWGVFRWQFP